MKQIFDSIERFLIGKIRLQPFYESLHRISIRGMNYMQSQEIHLTGEIGAMQFAKKRRGESEVVLFDIGANKGQFATEIVKVFKNNYILHSFEPSSKVFYELKEKFSEDPKVKTHQFGFGQEKGDIKLFNTGDLIGTIYPLGTSSKKFEIIKVTTLDEFCQNNNIPEIFYLKIDVEGAELDVLKGGKNLLKKNKIHFLQFEFGPNHMEARVYLKDFFSILENYNIFRIVKDGLRPIKKYNEILEIPICGNFFAENKALAKQHKNRSIRTTSLQ